MTAEEVEARVQAIKRLALDAKPDALTCIVRQCIEIQLKLINEREHATHHCAQRVKGQA